MQIYFIPFACSLAARIAVEEAGLDAEYIQVKPGQPLADGRDYTEVSPMGYVPALKTADNRIVTEGPAVLQYIADLAPGSELAPAHFSDGRYTLQRWLNFISTEVHKAVFAPIFGSGVPEETKAWAKSLAPRRFDLLSKHLEGREYLLDAFSVADAYLLAVLNWCEYAGIDPSPWPVLTAYRDRLRQRPSVARAMAAEAPLRDAA